MSGILREKIQIGLDQMHSLIKCGGVQQGIPAKTSTCKSDLDSRVHPGQGVLLNTSRLPRARVGHGHSCFVSTLANCRGGDFHGHLLNRIAPAGNAPAPHRRVKPYTGDNHAHCDLKPGGLKIPCRSLCVTNTDAAVSRLRQGRGFDWLSMSLLTQNSEASSGKKRAFNRDSENLQGGLLS